MVGDSELGVLRLSGDSPCLVAKGSPIAGENSPYHQQSGSLPRTAFGEMGPPTYANRSRSAACPLFGQLDFGTVPKGYVTSTNNQTGPFPGRRFEPVSE